MEIGDPHEISFAVHDLEEWEWSEEITLRLIYQLADVDDWEYYNILFHAIPERCRTYNVWRQLCVDNPEQYLEWVPSDVATQEFYEDVVSGNVAALCGIPRQFRTTKLCNTAINHSKFSEESGLRHVPHESQTEEMILEAINVYGASELSMAAFQTHDICYNAITNDATSIMWVIEQTFDVCELAINVAVEEGDDENVLHEVIASIRNHTPEVCISVLKRRPLALEYLRNQQKEVCLAAIRFAAPPDVPVVMGQIRDQLLEVCIAAYRKSQESYYAIREPTMRRRVVRLVLATDALIPLHGVGLSTSLLTEVCEGLQNDKFPPMMWASTQLLAPTQLWALAAKVKHAT